MGRFVCIISILGIGMKKEDQNNHVTEGSRKWRKLFYIHTIKRWFNLRSRLAVHQSHMAACDSD